MIKSLFFSVLFLTFSFAVSAQADWNGNWSGMVNVSNESGEAPARVEASVSLSENGTEIELTESLWGGNYVFTNADGVLYLGQMQVGTLTADKMDVKFADESDPNDVCTQVFTISKETSAEGIINLNYVDDYLCNGGYHDNVVGTLSPAE